ncbi:MAG: SusC/RagA family TonB-linked outer membrane protein [Bacteroidetes bacterium]|nr:SusC/RagA family TonB-linked outer membrane protein [Bacteroidota bacterium]
MTDANGKYTLSVAPNATLVFSFIGYRSQEVPVAGKNVINITMTVEAIGLEEVVAIGYGTGQIREISGSITKVSEKNFNKGINKNAVDLLQGKVAGLTITQSSGDVTSEKTIRLRGISSLTGSSSPFIVIDGVPGLSINSVAPQDIESISVLKDASAAAIYGSRSASGVILITTKKGSKNKTVVDYNGYAAVSSIVNKPDVLTADEWRQYASDNNIDVSGMDLGGNIDWFGEIMRTGISQNHDLAISGGGEAYNYRASVSYLGTQGVVNKNDIKRLNTRFVFNQKALNDKFNINIIGATTQRDYSPTNTTNFVLAYNMIPVVPVKNEDGTWFESLEYDQGNPVHNIELNSRFHKSNLYYINTKADLELFKGLNFNLSLLKERETNDYSQFNNSETEQGRNDHGFAQRSNSVTDKKLLELVMKYKKKIGEHNFGILGGYSYEDNTNQWEGAQNRQFVTNLFSYNNIVIGEDLRPGDVWSGKNMSKLISFFGRANYNFKGKYIFTSTLRKDGSSKFGKNNKWGTFPSISTGWVVSDEPFMSQLGFLDNLKLRAGYGVTGNQDGIDPYRSLELYGATGEYYDNGNWYRAFQISQNANPDLKWEQTAMFNIGVDYSIFKNRLTGTIEYYDKKTSDLLYTYSVPVPPNLYPNMLANVGDMSNKGIEVHVNGDVIRKSDFIWTVAVNFAHNKNKITRLSSENYTTTAIKTGSAWIRGGSWNTTHIVEEGKPLGTFYGWQCLGLDDGGHYILNDMVDGKSGLTDEDRTYIGDANPKFTYGISNIITYKNFEFTFFLRGVYGNDVLNYARMSYATAQWLPGANVLKQALTSGLSDSPVYNSYYIEKGSFLRMDNASFAYNIDTKNLLGIQKLKLYFTAQNLFTITNYTGPDPEVEMTGLDPGVQGREYYPKTRTLTLGINANF